VVGAARAKLRELKHVGGHVGQPTNYSLMNKVYETECTVSIQGESRQCGQLNISLFICLNMLKCYRSVC